MKNPSLLIKEKIQENIDKIWTAMPGRVNRVKNKKMLLDVTIKTKKGLPITLTNIPVLYPQSNSSKILFSIKPGDTVLLLWTKFSLDCLENEQIFRESKKWDIENVVAVPGFTLKKDVGKKINGMNIEIPIEGLNIISDEKITLSTKSLKYYDGNKEHNFVFHSDIMGMLRYISSPTEPGLDVNTSAIWTDTSENKMYLVSKTELGQRKVELG